MLFRLASAFFCTSILIGLTACAATTDTSSSTPDFSLPAVPEPVNELISTDQRVGPWFASYHEIIDKRVAKTDLGRLADRKMEASDFQIRVWKIQVWHGSQSGLEGFVLTRNGAHWISHSVIAFYPTAGLELGEPKDGWQSAWKEAVDLGIFTLPDADFSSCKRLEIMDGFNYVFEVKLGSNYRTYMYSVADGSNPPVICEEQLRVEHIIHVLRNRFGAFSNRLPS